MGRTAIRIAVAAWVLCAAGVAGALDVPLTYQRYPDDWGAFRPYGNASVKPTAEAPPGEWKLPALNSAKPMYSLLEMGNEKRLCVFDTRAQGGTRFDRLYFDDNGNGDLTDEEPIDATINAFRRRDWNAQFPAINTTVEAGGLFLPFSFKPYLYCYVPDTAPNDETVTEKHVRFMLQLNCGYSGEFELAGKKYRLLIGDANVNGRLGDHPVLEPVSEDDPRRMYTMGDKVFMAADRELGYNDEQAMGNLWVIDGKSYDVAVDAARMKLALTPSTRAVATLKLPAGFDRLCLAGEGSPDAVLVQGAGATLSIPPGRYRLLSYQAQCKETSGALWKLSAIASKGTVPFDIPEGGEAELRAGEPYVPRVELSKAEVRGGAPGDHVLAFYIEGCAGETVTGLEQASGTSSLRLAANNSKLPAEPTYRIVKPDGEVVSSGQFEYG